VKRKEINMAVVKIMRKRKREGEQVGDEKDMVKRKKSIRKRALTISSSSDVNLVSLI